MTMGDSVPRSNQDRVQHDYHDHSNDVDPTLSFGMEVPTGGDGGRGNPNHQQAFPVRLHYVLAELEKDGLNCKGGAQELRL